jgi:bile acid-coenzyme A ligase
MSNTEHFNYFNTDKESFFTPGKQLSNITKVKPDAPAIIYISPEGKESITTWRELDSLSSRIAWYLMNQGIGPGKSVVVALPNIPTHLALAFGIWKTGACYVPVSNRVPQKNMLEICECVSPSLVVTNRQKPAGYTSLTTAELKENCSGYSDEMPPDILAIPNIANCSGGTTGKTKVIQRNMPAGESDEGLRFYFAISGMNFEMRQLLAGPLFHGAPLTAAVNGLYCGNTLVMPATFDAENIVNLIKKYQIEYVQMVPTLMQRIIKLPNFNKDDLSSLKVLCHTGGICTKDLKLQWLEVMDPKKLYEMYSMTECIGMTSIRGDDWITHPGSVGKMLGGDISIRDDDGNELPANEIGMIYMNWGKNAPKVIYKNAPPLVADEKGYKSVGDMGYLDKDGYLYFADRRSDMIVTGGENVFAAEVEAVLKKHKKVVDAAVVGLPDSEWGHRVHAIVESSEPVSAKELLKFALNYLPPYKVPKSFEFLDTIPRNESGKLVRSLLIEESLKKGF